MEGKVDIVGMYRWIHSVLLGFSESEFKDSHK